MSLVEFLQEEPLTGQGLPVHDALAAGLDVLAGPQQVSFVPYVKTILPLDGFVFWLNASLLSPAQLAQHNIPSEFPVVIEGSLHYASQGSQQDDETIVIRSVDFTAETEIDAFAEVAPDVMYVGTWGTLYGSFRFTFSRRSSFYRDVSELYHYVGDAVYPVFDAQLIDNVAQFDQRQVVSNSMPIWLSMFARTPYPSPVTLSFPLPIYPALLVADNIPAPYAAVDIPEGATRVLQSFPQRGPSSSSNQLCADRVKLHLYGLRNDDVMSLRDYVLDYSANTGIIGLMNEPTIQDARRTQIELSALAMKKTIDFEVSYQQQSAREVARAMIRSATVSVAPNPLPVPVPSVIPS